MNHANHTNFMNKNKSNALVGNNPVENKNDRSRNEKLVFPRQACSTILLFTAYTNP